MNTTLAFDVYGTLIDTNGVVAALQELVNNFQGWTKSSNAKKKELWEETLEWADNNGFKDLIPELYDDDMFERE